jgi:hypothetical protein
MKTCVRPVSSALVALALFTLRASAADITVVDVEGEKPAKVQAFDVVRVTGRGIAGATIDVKVDGDGRLQATNDVRRVKNGQPVIGATTKEFLIKPAKKGGTIQVTVTIKNPTSDTPTVQKYHIDVE